MCVGLINMDTRVLTKDRLEHLRNEIRSTRYRVVYLYNRFPTTIHSDNVLLDYFRRIFDGTMNKESSIKRCGRLLRQRYPERYKRTEEELIKAVQQEEVWIEEMRE